MCEGGTSLDCYAHEVYALFVIPFAAQYWVVKRLTSYVKNRSRHFEPKVDFSGVIPGYVG